MYIHPFIDHIFLEYNLIFHLLIILHLKTMCLDYLCFSYTARKKRENLC